jgi:hypothetical protein
MLAFFIGLAVFGVGVTAVDLIVGFAHSSGHGDSADGHDGADGSDGHDADGSPDADGSGGHDAGGHDAGGHDAGGHDGHDGHDSEIAAAADYDGSHDGHAHADTDGHADAAHDGNAHSDGDREGGIYRAEHQFSVVAAPDPKVRAIAKVISWLRGAVYFSAGMGLAGIASLLGGGGGLEAFLWGGAGGAITTAVTYAVRKLARAELDSSIKDDDVLMEIAEVDIPVEKGKMGRAIVRTYGIERQITVRSADGSLPIRKGEKVRVVDVVDGCYMVEPEPFEELPGNDAPQLEESAGKNREGFTAKGRGSGKVKPGDIS